MLSFTIFLSCLFYCSELNFGIPCFAEFHYRTNISSFLFCQVSSVSFSPKSTAESLVLFDGLIIVSQLSSMSFPYHHSLLSLGGTCWSAQFWFSFVCLSSRSPHVMSVWSAFSALVFVIFASLVTFLRSLGLVELSNQR